MFKKALVLAPHTDDGELGCGATISRFLKSNIEVHYIAFSICEESVPEGLPKDILKTELYLATSKIGILHENVHVLHYPVRHFGEQRQFILDDMIQFKRKLNPDIVFMPSINDIHQDHNAIAMEGLRAFKDITIFAYEEPWNNYTFNNQVFVKVTEEDVERKINALQQYVSQKNRIYTSPDYIRSLLSIHGSQIGTDYAEIFETPRLVY